MFWTSFGCPQLIFNAQMWFVCCPGHASGVFSNMDETTSVYSHVKSWRKTKSQTSKTLQTRWADSWGFALIHEMAYFEGGLVWWLELSLFGFEVVLKWVELKASPWLKCTSLCDTPYCAILFQGGEHSPKMVQNPPVVHRHICAIAPFATYCAIIV